MKPPSLPKARAEAVAAVIDLDVQAVGICHACLSFVSFPLDLGEVPRAEREARLMAPILWDEGLRQPALDSLHRACAAGVPDAEAALRDAASAGGRSGVAHAIVMRLAADLAAQMTADFHLIEAVSSRLPLGPPELN